MAKCRSAVEFSTGSVGGGTRKDETIYVRGESMEHI